MSLKRVEIGSIGLPTGRIVACDPIVNPESDHFIQTVPPGEYPIALNVLMLEDTSDERVAFAELLIADGEVNKWEFAITEETGFDIYDLEQSEMIGYGVDAGTGSFGSPEAMAGLVEELNREEDYYEEVIDLMQKTYVHTWSWANKNFGKSDYNIAMFSSGWGDGVYPTFIARDRSGNILKLVTDFLAINFKDDAQQGNSNAEPSGDGSADR